MILILSQDGLEQTTDDVVEWIRHLGGDCVRVNGSDLTGLLHLEMEVDADGPVARFRVDEREVCSRDVRVVWLRRWQRRTGPAVKPVPGAEALAQRVSTHLAGEAHAVSRAFFALFGHARWLTRPDELGLNKVHALQAAAAAGLEVPATLVTSRRSEIERFRLRHGRIVTKSVGEMAVFDAGPRAYGLYTAEATAQDTAALPEVVFPSLVQALVEKAFEVRAFYLDGRVWAMAIFSQADQQTAVDFRQYNLGRPNRTVPYRLPAPVLEAIGRLMPALGLTSGSLDMIRTPDGRHVFLEVNPAGQFRMVSLPCNFHLEKRVAEHLIREAAHAAA